MNLEELLRIITDAKNKVSEMDFRCMQMNDATKLSFISW